ncbi:hypothetical protein [Stenotrophomonas rhizophila]|uniref:hypothetical protein n=1 Tax=Stenotrophomonas rhizophila TaxID=216778 RepID=UPI0028D47A28|nr:hypothetical protein [Stenotrophomonas rhizophila]
MFDLQRKPLTGTRMASLLSLPTLLLVGLVIAAPASAARPVNALRHGDIAPADAFRAAYAPDAIAAARTPLDPANVPAHLRGLVPLAEYWGIGDDVLREMMQEGESPAKKKAMADAVTPHNAAITAWLDGLRTGEPMSDEAAAFMYMQLGLDEMGLFQTR